MRENNWKLLCDYDGGRLELYDIEVDPGETLNLAETQEERVNLLTEQLLTWWSTMPELSN